MLRIFSGLDHVHFVGIGGAGMSGIAEVLARYEVTVSGCDQARSEAVEHLEALGITVHRGHSPEHLAGVDLVVKSSAISDENPEIRAARERGITVIRRAEMLAELMRLKYGIAVAGTHGKTTTTSMVGTMVTDAGLDPTVIVGGRMQLSGTGARVGASDYLIAEADEYDRSFLRLMPVVAVVTNIDRDHLDTYGDLDGIRDAFVEFASRVPFFGQIILCLDDANIQAILPQLMYNHRVETYGTSPQAGLVASGIVATEGRTRFQVTSRVDGELGQIEITMPGGHNVRNALAAVAVGRALGLDFAAIRQGLAAFSGVHRRFERLGTWRGATVIDDYAHHPTEVRATLEAARQAFSGRVHAIFQPHLYTRTRDHYADFGRSLLDSDTATVTAIYGSREQPIEGISGEMVARAARDSGHRHSRYVEAWADVPALLADHVAEGDVVLTLGAGDINKLGERLAGVESA